MKTIVIYPGRFQPMLSHHAEVYRALQQQFPNADIYVGTSDKVEGDKSPFNFKEKQLIAQAHGIDPNKVLLAPRPYHKDDYNQFDENSTVIVFAVGEKDLDRFPFSNIDSSTGLDMTVRGEPKPKYYQMINTYSKDPQPMANRGYITIAPTVRAGDEVASASAFRNALKVAPNVESAKEIFTKQFGNYNDKVFKLIYNKIVSRDMNEELNRLRKLAGLQIVEAGFDDYDDDDDGDFGEPEEITSFKQEAMQRQLMRVVDSFGADVKNPVRSVTPDDGKPVKVSRPEAKALLSLLSHPGAKPETKIELQKKLQSKEGLEFFLKFVNEKGLVKPETADNEWDESLDLSDIKAEYGIEEAEQLDEWAPLIAGLARLAPTLARFTGPVWSGLKAAGGKVGSALGLGAAGYGLGAGATSGIASNAVGLGMFAGLLYGGKKLIDWMMSRGASQEEAEAAESEWQQRFRNSPEHRQLAMQMQSQSESVDPRMEPSREQVAYDEAMNALEKGGEAGLAKHLGMSEQELDQEINQWCAENGKHADDDREEAIDGVLDDAISNADWKDHYEAVEEAKCGCCGNDPCDCAPDCEGCESMDESGCGGSHKKKKAKEAIEDTSAKALEAAMAEIRTLAGI